MRANEIAGHAAALARSRATKAIHEVNPDTARAAGRVVGALRALALCAGAVELADLADEFGAGDEGRATAAEARQVAARVRIEAAAILADLSR